MNQQLFTKKEVLLLLNELLQMPDTLIDAVENENTDNGASELLQIAIEGLTEEQLKVGDSIYNYLILISSIEAKSKEGKFCKNIAKNAFNRWKGQKLPSEIFE